MTHQLPVASATGLPSPACPRRPETFPLSELAACCACETQKFHTHQASDERYCFEVFRRAIAERDDAAWACIYQQYAPLVLTWIAQHQGVSPVLEQDGSASLVNASFAKFSRALPPAKMAQFDSLAALLKYLKMCAHSVVADEVRSHQSRLCEERLETIEHEPAIDDPAEDVVSHISAQGFWQAILKELKSEDERVLIYLTYIHSMKPCEIQSQYRRLFPTAEDVYRVRRNILERLRRSSRVQKLRQLTLS